MKNVDRSLQLTHFIIRACYLLLGVAAVILPFLLRKGLYYDMLGGIKQYILIPFYAVVPAGYAALICLDRLLINIKRDIVFDSSNTKLLGIISLACAYAALVGLAAFVYALIGSFVFDTMLILAAGELFMALIVRVVGNVFDRAIKIKEENDLTV